MYWDDLLYEAKNNKTKNTYTATGWDYYVESIINYREMNELFFLPDQQVNNLT